MKIVQVTYTTKTDFAATNQANIRMVMQELGQLNHPGMRYTACLLPDGRSFTHLAFFETDEDQHLLNELPAFKHFQQELKAGGLATPPVQTLLSLIGSSPTPFNP